MVQFLEDLKTYLENRFADDDDFSSVKKPSVYDGYQVGHEPKETKPEIQVHPLDNSERVNYTTFCGKNSNNISIQFTCYTGQVKIARVDRPANQASMIMAEKVEQYINEYVYSVGNRNILQFRKVSTSPALPMNDGGTIYMTAIRYSFDVEYPYVVG